MVYPILFTTSMLLLALNIFAQENMPNLQGGYHLEYIDCDYPKKGAPYCITYTRDYLIDSDSNLVATFLSKDANAENNTTTKRTVYIGKLSLTYVVEKSDITFTDSERVKHKIWTLTMQTNNYDMDVKMETTTGAPGYSVNNSASISLDFLSEEAAMAAWRQIEAIRLNFN